MIHSDATHLQAWEKLTLNSLGFGVYDIQTINGHYLTAVGGGGRDHRHHPFGCNEGRRMGEVPGHLRPLSGK